MAYRIVLVVLIALSAVTEALGCQLDDLPGVPKPSWEQRIQRAETIFIGRVLHIRSLPRAENDIVVFKVETPIRGAVGSTYETRQGGGGDCGIPFEVGKLMVFAGGAIWDPTFELSEPLTPEQRKKLAVIKYRVMAREPAVHLP